MKNPQIAALLAAAALAGCGDLTYSARSLLAADMHAAAHRATQAQLEGLLAADDPYAECPKAEAARVQALARVLERPAEGAVDLAMRLYIRSEYLRTMSPACAHVLMDLLARRAGSAGLLPF